MSRGADFISLLVRVSETTFIGVGELFFLVTWFLFRNLQNHGSPHTITFHKNFFALSLSFLDSIYMLYIITQKNIIKIIIYNIILHAYYISYKTTLKLFSLLLKFLLALQSFFFFLLLLLIL